MKNIRELLMGRKKQNINMNPIAYLILKPLLRFILGRMFNVEPVIPDEVKKLKPPYLLLANHQGFWDPFLLGMYLEHPVFFLTSDAVFRSRFFKFVLRFLGAIPKTKAKSDIDALKNIIDIKERGQIIGIFPEGRRTWDGVTLPLVFSTSKLVRMLKVPVVSVVFDGGFFSQPRWGKEIRKGRVRMIYKKVLSGDELKSMKINDIHRTLADSIYHDEVQQQMSERIEYRGSRIAENIEQFIFACPVCRQIGRISSEGRSFSCSGCGRIWEIDNFQEIRGANGDGVFNNVRDWNRWQLEHLESALGEAKSAGEVLLADENIVFHTGYKSRVPVLLTRGGMRLTASELEIFDRRGNAVKSLNVDELSGINIQNKEVLEFYYQGVLYTVRDNKKRFSSYKWLKALEFLQQDKMKQFEAD